MSFILIIYFKIIRPLGLKFSLGRGEKVYGEIKKGQQIEK
jgi:hypothetical protein